MKREPLLQITPAGLHCAAGDFYIDPWRPVPRAIITHAHSDHARRGMGRYLTVPEGRRVLQSRMGAEAVIDTVEFGEVLDLNGVRVSLHPAGHILGSAQVRVEHQGEVWVASGDYKVAPDVTCTPFEPVRCHTFITESTFGLPIYRWPDMEEVKRQINDWWRENQAEGRTSLLMGYALGKSQRIIAMLDPSIGPIYTHGAVEVVNEQYRETGIELPPTTRVSAELKIKDYSNGIVIAPPSAQATPWTRKFGDVSAAFASGWMMIRGARRRRAVDRGFVVSDHADWPDLMNSIKATEAERVLVTHGSVATMVRYLREQGLEADGLKTQFEGEAMAAETEEPAEEPAAESMPAVNEAGRSSGTAQATWGQRTLFDE